MKHFKQFDNTGAACRRNAAKRKAQPNTET